MKIQSQNIYFKNTTVPPSPGDWMVTPPPPRQMRESCQTLTSPHSGEPFFSEINATKCNSFSLKLDRTLSFLQNIILLILLKFDPKVCTEMKWNESGFRPPLCTDRLNWARRTSWGWWDDWDDTVLQTRDSKFEPWQSEAEHATSRSRRLPAILTFTRGWGRNIFVSFKPPRLGTEPRTLAWKAAVLTSTLGPPPKSVHGL